MRMLITTDMEGCAGILNFPDWVYPDGKYYETGKMLLTQEVNAAICGFMENGFDEVIVLDAHGHGGVDITQLDKRALHQRGFPGPYALGLRSDYDALAAGFNPDYCVAVWSGNDDHSELDEAYFKTPKLIWRDTFNALYPEGGGSWYKRSDAIIEKRVDPISGKESSSGSVYWDKAENE